MQYSNGRTIKALSISLLFKESRTEKYNLPSLGQVQLVDFHKQPSAFGKLIRYQQTLQLGLETVKTCLSKALSYHYSRDERFIEKLFSIIFYESGE